jgi:hypothetical protein
VKVWEYFTVINEELEEIAIVTTTREVEATVTATKEGEIDNLIKGLIDDYASYATSANMLKEIVDISIILTVTMKTNHLSSPLRDNSG